MPEYLKFRCCMCPNEYGDEQNPVCKAGNPCRFVKTYMDSRGWLYRVMCGIGADSYKARCNKPGGNGWKCCSFLPWRNSFDEAQADLNAHAEKKGWKEYEYKNTSTYLGGHRT